MTREERRQLLTAAELADARNQAQRALDSVGVPSELIESLRPILAPAAEACALEEAATQPMAA